ALAHMREHYGPMLATGTETLWESFEPVASLCHAFSATPVYQLSAHVLGVTPLSPGFARARIAPQLVDLRSASGRYPTPHGELAVEWSRDGESGLEVRIDVPAGIEAEFVVPPGYQEPPAARRLAAGTHRWRLPARR
ncbi:MAG: alpha-L-rhamnosidase, partial [Gammaproteobacteria bacterium]|nr:alpha-L-rhamnosidase [Gammaproteobacteria bacterium]